MLSLFGKGSKPPASPAAPSAAAPPPSTKKTFGMKNMFATKITDAPITTMEQKAAVNKRFDTLYERFKQSADPGVKFLVNQLMVNRTVLDLLITKSVLGDSDVEFVNSLSKPLVRLFDILISDEFGDLRSELTNYNMYLLMNYRTGIRELIAIKNRTKREAERKKLALPAVNAAGNAEKTRVAQDALANMLDAMTKLPMMRPEIQRTIQKSQVNAATALNALTKAAAPAAMAASAAAAPMAAAESTNANVNAYMATLMAKNLAARMPVAPTTPLTRGGKRKTRSKKQQRRKTRKLQRK